MISEILVGEMIQLRYLRFNSLLTSYEVACSEAGHEVITHTGYEAVCSKVSTLGMRWNTTISLFENAPAAPS